MNSFDAGILYFLNGFAHRSWTCDRLIYWLTFDDFQKGGVIALLLWWAWFLPTERSESNREVLICTSAAAPFALVLSRIVSIVVPFRIRPIHAPELQLHHAYPMPAPTLIDWNSFPSDHAVIFFTLATGLFLVSKRLGWIAFLHTTFIICIPRIYLGIHYPTDILAGAALGIAVARFACLPVVRGALVRPIRHWMVDYPPMFYTFCFFYTVQIATGFGWIQETASMMVRMSKNVVMKLL